VVFAAVCVEFRADVLARARHTKGTQMAPFSLNSFFAIFDNHHTLSCDKHFCVDIAIVVTSPLTIHHENHIVASILLDCGRLGHSSRRLCRTNVFSRKFHQTPEAATRASSTECTAASRTTIAVCNVVDG
jgi:hypothetical protein